MPRLSLAIAFVLSAVLVVACGPATEPPPVFFDMPAWQLVDQDDEPFGSERLEGQPYVASFFFTSCPSICPRLMAQMRVLQDRLDAAGLDEVRMVSISVDPRTDKPERLVAYGQDLGVDWNRWSLVTGRTADVREAVEKGFKTSMGDKLEKDGIVDITHSTKLVLVDAQGRVRGYFSSDDEGLEALLTSLRSLSGSEDG